MKDRSGEAAAAGNIYETLAAAPSAGVNGSIYAVLAARAVVESDAALDIWHTLEERLDPALFRPKLAADIEVKIFRLRWGNDYAMIANPRALLHYQIEARDAELLHMMDGTRTVSDLLVERLQDDGDLDIDAVTELVRLLNDNGFLDPEPVDIDAAVDLTLNPVTRSRRRFREFAKTLMIGWEGAHDFVLRLHRYVAWTFNPVAGVSLVLVALAGFAAFFSVNASGRYALDQADAPLDSLVLIGLGLVLTFVHEFSHAVVLVHMKRRIKSAGFMLYFGSPAFFVDASDGLMMDRHQRMLQAAGGPFSELVLAGLATIVLWAFPTMPGAAVLYKFAVLNYLVIFLNIVPLLELDGYWILADLIQVPDLRPRSLQFVQHDLWHKLRVREGLSKQELGLALYGILGIAFTIFSVVTSVFFWQEIFGGLVSGLWHGGIGSKLLLAVLALLFGGPVIRGLVKLVLTGIARGRTEVRALRFRLETKWRVEAAELFDALAIFEDLPEEVLSDLAGRVHLRPFRAGQAVFRQGERADALYVIRVGRIRIEEEDPASGDTRVLRTLERGASFGELGLLELSPRAATARAEGAAELFMVDKGTFDRLLADKATPPQLAPTLQSLAGLRELPAFAHLGSRELGELLEHGAWVSAAPGEELVTQGDVGDAFYAIGSGQLEVLQDGSPIRKLGPGGFFGEIALLRDVPRTATVVARTPVRAYRLDREGFDALIAEAFGHGTLRPAIDRTWEH